MSPEAALAQKEIENRLPFLRALYVSDACMGILFFWIPGISPTIKAWATVYLSHFQSNITIGTERYVIKAVLIFIRIIPLLSLIALIPSIITNILTYRHVKKQLEEIAQS